MSDLSGDRKKVCIQIDSMRDEIVGFLQEMIRVPSEVPPGNYDAIVNHYSSKLKEFGFETKIIQKPGTKKPNVLARLPGTQDRPTLIFCGHLDTVPGGQGWNPFTGSVKDNRIYGRGAMDCKGMVTAYTMAAKAIRAAGITLPGNIDMLSIVDDEIGGDNTWHYIVDEKLVDGDAIIAEGGGQEYIINCSSSVLVLEINVKGRATHAQTERTRKRGVNAILKLNKVIAAIEEYEKVLWKKESKIPNLERCYMNIALVKGGVEGIWNIFPEHAMMQMELRLVPEYDPDDIINEIKTVLNKLKSKDNDLDVEVKELWRVPGFKVPDDFPVIKILQKNIGEVRGEEIPTGGLGGFVPLGHFDWQMGLKGVTWNPGKFNECNLHQIDENVGVDEVIDATKVYALTAIDFLNR
jgi:succinyl-diaminopimelate desuccinylase